MLRKSENKDLSHIYDFIVLPHSKFDLSKSLEGLIEKEKVRFDEFSKCCENKNQLTNVFKTHKYRHMNDLKTISINYFKI